MPLLTSILLTAALCGAYPLDPPVTPTAPAASLPVAPAIAPKAEALLAANLKTMLALKTYRAECHTTMTFPPSEKKPQAATRYQWGTLTAAKPNRMRYDRWEMKKGSNGLSKIKQAATNTFACDGARCFKQFGTTYREDDRTEPEDMVTILEPWNGFYSSNDSHAGTMSFYKTEGHLKNLRLAGKEAVDGVLCDVVVYKVDTNYEGEGLKQDGKLFIGPDKLVRRQIETVHYSNRDPYTRDFTLRNIKTNFAPPPTKTFVYTPPPGVKPRDAAAEAASQPQLLVAGTPAPDFTVEDLDGKPVKLSDFRGKTVLLDFWATWCGPCMSAMPHTNDAGRKFKDKNVVVVAVNVWDEKDAYKAWVPKNQSKYDAIVFLLDPKGRNGDVAKTLYNVSGIPTQYLIDAQGIIRASFVGYDDDPKPLETAITKASEGK